MSRTSKVQIQVSLAPSLYAVRQFLFSHEQPFWTENHCLENTEPGQDSSKKDSFSYEQLSSCPTED